MSVGQQIRYLLVTQIPFARANGDAKLDALRLRDLEGLRGSMGPIVIAAPQFDEASLRGWGPTLASLKPDGNFEIVGLPAIRSRRDSFKWNQARRVLADQVRRADLVHTSNYFSPYLGLGYAHHLAVSLGKKTLFVVAEDFVDMLSWEWARNDAIRFERWRRRTALNGMDKRIRLMCGAIPPGPSVYATIAEGDAFVMPHRTTDFGRAFYDAMAGGAPVLAFRSAASIDTVRDEQDRWFCPIGDPEALAAALERLDRNRELLIAAAENARERALREAREFWFGLRAQRVRKLMGDNS